MNFLVYSSVSILTLVLILTLQSTYADSFFEDSIERIPKMQANTSGFQQGAWKGVSNVVAPLVILAPYLTSYLILEQRARSFYYLLLTTVAAAISLVLQLVTLQPRPYWVSDQISAFDCGRNYGNPSGHSLLVVAISVASVLDLNEYISEHAGNTCKHWLTRSVLLLATFGFCGLVGYSRVFLGTHSTNQVYLGMQIGLWLAINAHLLRDSIIESVKSIIEGSEDVQHTQMMIWSSIIFFIGVLI